jgi:hypothetical protein
MLRQEYIYSVIYYIVMEVNRRNMHKFTGQEQLHGGKTHSIYKSLANVLKKRKKCSASCYFFDTCPLMPISQADHKCKMRELPESVRKRFNDVWLNGEEGMLNDIKKSIYMYGLNASDQRSLKEYIELMLKLHKACYGDKSQVITNNEPLQININQLSVDKLPEKEIREIGEIGESKRSLAYKAALEEKLAEEIAIENDPESLFNSDLEMLNDRRKT